MISFSPPSRVKGVRTEGGSEVLSCDPSVYFFSVTNRRRGDRVTPPGPIPVTCPGLQGGLGPDHEIGNFVCMTDPNFLWGAVVLGLEWCSNRVRSAKHTDAVTVVALIG